MVNVSEHKQLHLIIIVDGKDKHVNAPGGTLVLDVIREALGPQREAEAGNYDLVPAGASPLDPALTLDQSGVKDRAELSLNKKEGGGGEQ